jgi:flavin-binding protein dodecin
MSVAKVITIVGSSPDGFAEATAAAVKEAAKTVRGIHGVDVTSMTCTVEGDQIKAYRVTVNIAFAVESSS